MMRLTSLALNSSTTVGSRRQSSTARVTAPSSTPWLLSSRSERASSMKSRTSSGAFCDSLTAQMAAFFFR